MTPQDRTTERDAAVRQLMQRADELAKAATNRADPAVGRAAAITKLDEAAALAAGLPDGPPKDTVLVAIGRRRDDLAWMDADVARGTDGAPVYTERPLADPLPQPTAATLNAPLQRHDADQVPANQRIVTSWPVLHLGRAPKLDLQTWRFTASGMVEGHRLRWTWQEFRSLPTVTLHSDFHCVTGWSRLDNTWEGIRFRDVAAAAGMLDGVTHAIVNGANAYSANIDLPTLLRDDVLFAWSHDGRPLEPEHGGPLRLVVASRYAWKSVKWVESVQFLDRDVPGYWERRGYHNVADPWLEQRYS